MERRNRTGLSAFSLAESFAEEGGLVMWIALFSITAALALAVSVAAVAIESTGQNARF